MIWHLFDTASIWMREFASAMSAEVEVRCWCPEIRNFGHVESWTRWEHVDDLGIEIAHFPLQRAYSRLLVRSLLPFERGVVRRLRQSSRNGEPGVLVCTAPYYAPVAELWAGPVVYYSTDLTCRYTSASPAKVRQLDARICRRATHVFPNSRSIAGYLVEEAGCDFRKITVLPNATRESNLMVRPPLQTSEPPADIADLPRPLIGVIGNLADNIDWRFLSNAIRQTADLSWVFVGPTSMRMENSRGAQLRTELSRSGGRIRFIGPRRYAELSSYARCFDAALIPYSNIEPTISGSATRFYEHLAACRPILATRAHRELLDKEPLLILVSDATEFRWEIERLRRSDFRDGYEGLRWKASQEGTWSERARQMIRAVTSSREALATMSVR